MIGSDTESDETPRRRQALDQVDLDRRVIACQERGSGVEGRGAGADDRDAERAAHASILE
jgi:hypothetical protein